jgi:hypothetical protein
VSANARWNLLRELAELFLKEPLPESLEVDATKPLALAEWAALTSDRYDAGQAFVFVDVWSVDWIDPEIDPRPRAAESDPPFPQDWLRIATDGSGHAYYFVDAESSADDPPVWHWDEECSDEDPTVALPRLSEFLTWVVLEGAFGQTLGELQPEVEALESGQQTDRIRERVTSLELVPWATLGDLEVRATRDRSVFLTSEGTLWTRTAAAREPFDELLEEEAAARRAEAEQKEVDKVEELASKGLDGAGLLADLDALGDKLTRLEAMFVRDFRMQVAANTVHYGQFTKAAEIVAKHGGGK